MRYKKIKFCECGQLNFVKIFEFKITASVNILPYENDILNIIQRFLSNNNISLEGNQILISLKICNNCLGFNSKLALQIFENFLEEEIFKVLLKRIVTAQKEKLKKELNKVAD